MADLEAAPETAPSTPRPSLTVVSPDGEDRGTVQLAGQPLSVGRDPHNDIVLDADVAQIVSREHCVVEPVGRRWWVRDLDSRNHTYLERAGLSAQVDRAELMHGDAVCVKADRDPERTGDGEVRYWRLAFSDPGETQLASAGKWLQYYPGRETVWVLGGAQLSQLFDAPPKARKMLLHLLARHRALDEPRDGVLATFSELKTLLWPQDGELEREDSAVAHVAWELRTALGDDQHRLLRTETGVGYRLVPRP